MGLYQNFKYYGSISSIEEFQEIIISGVLDNDNIQLKVENLRSANTDEQRTQIKKTLPAITLAGNFGDDRTATHTLADYTGLIQVDIDDVEDPELVKRKVSTDPHVILCFISPSGKGVKAVVRVNCDQSQHSEASEQYYNYLEKILYESR